jgi:hypothetical protein
VMMLPVWYVEGWVGGPLSGTVFLFAVLVAAALGASLRLHLYFLARQVPEEVARQRLRTLPWIRLADTAFALTLGAGAVAIGVGHREFAMLLITMSIVTLAGSLVIEPTTARAAFGATAQPATE